MLKKLFFSQVSPVIRLGQRKSLEASDLFDLPAPLSPRTFKVDEDKVDWSTWRRLLGTLYSQVKVELLVVYLMMVVTALLHLSAPVLVFSFVESIEKGMPQPWVTVLYGLGVGLGGFLSGLMMQHYFVRSLGMYQIITNTLNRFLFRHSLRLSKGARDQIPVGDIVNHMSSDSDSVANLTAIVGDVIYNFVITTGFVILLFWYLGPAAWVGVILMSFLIPLSKKVGNVFSTLGEDLMKRRDARVTLMSQILTSIRVVKFFVWETSIQDEVEGIRKEEIRIRRELARAEMASTLVYVAVGTFVLFAVLLTHVLLGGAVQASLLFTAVSLFRLVEDPFSMFSRLIAMLANARVSAKRLSDFAQQKERTEGTVEILAQTLDTSSATAISIQNVSVRYGSFVALQDVTVDIQKGENFAIVGPVGSGKTSLLNALLGEVPFEGAIARQGGTAALVPQEAFIINTSIRENLSFGRSDVTADEWQEAIRATCFDEDLQQMQSGLDTEIGERGVNLSGGQKQRLSLARSYLQRPQIVFLDDPLSAVDPRTENELVKRLILGAWGAKTRVTVTHRLSHLQEFDRILFLQAGRVVGLGTFTELRQNCEAFREFLKENNTEGLEELHEIAGTEKESAKSASGVVEAVSVVRVTEDEELDRGAVKGTVYWQYILSLGGLDPQRRVWILTVLFAVALTSMSLPVIQKGWLALVSDAKNGISPLSGIMGYGLIGILTLAGVLVSDLYWLERGLRAGRDLHDEMLKAVLGAQIRYFDSTPVGRILQRFSRDMEAVDLELQWSFEASIKNLIHLLVNLGMIVIAMPLALVLFAPVFYVYYIVQRAYRASAREVKRLDSVSRSPRYAHFKETLQGLVVLRSLDREKWFFEEFLKRLEFNQKMFFGHYMINRWFSSRIPVVGGVVAMLTTTLISWSVYRGQMAPGVAGFLTVSSLGIWGILNWGIRIWAEVEAKMTSLERVKTVIRTPQEGHANEKALVPVPRWPVAGAVSFRQVQLKYAEHLPLVLKDLSFEIQAGQRVGLIGRTGSGKSTVFQALYRFMELSGGEICIDGVNIAEIPLPQLRRALAIIPQDPALFMGTLRSNLDRFGKFRDDEIESVLEQVQLAGFVRSLEKGLQSEVVENGANLSQGQRQLMCLARALLNRSRVLILDEATASVDVKTDALVQKVIREACATAPGGPMTMIVIAHRLGTVKDCDLILELSQGRLKRRLQPRREISNEVKSQGRDEIVDRQVVTHDSNEATDFQGQHVEGVDVSENDTRGGYTRV